MKPMQFRCPKVGLSVQTLMSDDCAEPGTQSYETVVCSACAGIHLVNRETGQVAGQRPQPRVGPAP